MDENTWNHRVILHDENPTDRHFAIHECHYGSDRRIPHSWTENPAGTIGESVYELRETLARMFRACDRPALVIRGEKLEEWQPSSAEGNPHD